MKSAIEPRSSRASRCRPSVAWLALALLGLGCRVSSLDESTSRATKNECTDDGDCRGGRCGDGICRANSGEIQNVLLEIIPPMETSSDTRQQQLSSVRYLKVLGDELAAVDISRSEHLDLELNPIVEVNGSITMPPAEEGCTPPEGEARANVKLRFTPSEKILGLPGTTYSTDAKAADDGTLEFTINVPPGRYDIYLQVVDNWPGCELNSRLLRGERIGLDAAPDEVIDQTNLGLELSDPSTLTLDVIWPRDDVTLDGWTVDMVDDKTGLPISTRVTLQNYTAVGSGIEYQGLQLKYTPVKYPPEVEPPGEGLELVRLSPPESVIAPTLYIPRRAVELLEKGHGTINQLTELPPVISVEGQVVLKQADDEQLTMPCAQQPSSGGANPCGVPMEVRIISAEPPLGTSLSGLDRVGSGTIAYFEQTTETNEGLTFLVDLMPGDYRVIVVPALDLERPWAGAETYWSVSDDVSKQHGKTVTVRPRAEVDGEIRTANHTGVTGFDVTLSASLEELTPGSLFQTQLGTFPFVPRASLVASAAEGAFSVRSDYGTFDLSIRPGPETGFAWHVQPSVEVTDTRETLDDIVLPWPAVYSGTVSSLSAGRLPGAVIRAYAYLDPAGEVVAPDEATSVVQVAETRVDEDGHYRLLLPSRVGAN